MKKLKLDPADLQVDSFATKTDVENGGTVLGRETHHPPSWNFYCQSGGDTCYNMGCGTGLTSICATENATDCPGQSECGPYTEGHTCYGSCTEVEGCTYCGAVC